MLQIINKYLEFLLNSISNDSKLLSLNSNYWWNFLIVPFILIFILLIVKYIFLTSIIWIPINLCLSGLTNFLKELKK